MSKIKKLKQKIVNLEHDVAFWKNAYNRQLAVVEAWETTAEQFSKENLWHTYSGNLNEIELRNKQSEINIMKITGVMKED